MTAIHAQRACAIESTGAADAPVIAILGGISSSKHVTATAANPKPGWWNDFVGTRKPIDTLEYRVIGFDYIDSTSGSDGLSTQDQAAAVSAALNAEGISKVHAVVGASYGGMVALALAETEPSLVERLIVISAAHQSSAGATVQRTLQRKVVELGVKAGLERDALTIARGMAIATYSTDRRLTQRFDWIDPLEREREIDRFLTLAGVKFASRYKPEAFLEVSRSLDLHDVLPESITCPTTLIGVVEDALVPPPQLRELESRIAGPCTLELVSSIHGHDAFLDDPLLISPIVTRAISSNAEALT